MTPVEIPESALQIIIKNHIQKTYESAQLYNTNFAAAWIEFPGQTHNLLDCMPEPNSKITLAKVTYFKTHPNGLPAGIQITGADQNGSKITIRLYRRLLDHPNGEPYEAEPTAIFETLQALGLPTHNKYKDYEPNDPLVIS
jgi:hypothetical protein